MAGVKIPKYMKEIQKRAIEKKEKSDRIGGIMKYSGNAEFNQGTDAIISYLTTQQTGDITSDDDYMSISESIEEDHMYDYLPEEVIDEMITPAEVRKIVDSGRMINYADYKKIEIIKTLEENGFNFFSNLLTEGMDKDAIRAISRQFNMDRISEEDLKNMTKKQRKKLKKLMQKQKKDRVDRMVADRRISEMMLKSRVRLAVEDNDITNFRLSDVIPDDYD